MTSTQKHALEAFGNRIICMDTTHKTTQYAQIKLLTLMVADDYGEGTRR